jgi:hypothetical protein
VPAAKGVNFIQANILSKLLPDVEAEFLAVSERVSPAFQFADSVNHGGLLDGVRDAELVSERHLPVRPANGLAYPYAVHQLIIGWLGYALVHRRDRALGRSDIPQRVARPAGRLLRDHGTDEPVHQLATLPAEC